MAHENNDTVEMTTTEPHEHRGHHHGHHDHHDHHHKDHSAAEVALSAKEEALKKKAARDRKIAELNTQLEEYYRALTAIITTSQAKEPSQAAEPHLERARTAGSIILITAGLTNEAAYTFVNTMCQLALIMSISITNIPMALRWSMGALTCLFSVGIEVEVYRGEMAEGLANFKMIAKEHLKDVLYDHTRTIKKNNETIFDLVDTINEGHNHHHHGHESDDKSPSDQIKEHITTSLAEDKSLANFACLLIIVNHVKHHQDDLLTLIKGSADPSLKNIFTCIDTINTLNGKLNLLKRGKDNKEERLAIRKKIEQMLTLLEWHWIGDNAFELYSKDGKTPNDKARLYIAMLELLNKEQQHDRMLNSLVKGMINDGLDSTLKKKITTKKICAAVFGRFLLPLAAAPSIFFGFSDVFSQMLGDWSSTATGAHFVYAIGAIAALSVMLYISNEFVKIIGQNKFKHLFLDYIDKFKALKKKKAWGKIFLHVFIPMVIVASIAVACSFGFSSYAGYAIGGAQTMLGGTLSATTTTLMNVSAGFYMGGDIGVFMGMNMVESFNKITLDDIKGFFVNVRDHLKAVFYTKIRDNFRRAAKGKLAWLRCTGLALATVIDCTLALISVTMLPAFFIAHLIASSLAMNANKKIVESTATTISASINEAGADMCFMHGHTNIIEIVYRTLLYIGPVWISTLIKSIAKAFKEDQATSTNDKTPRWCRLFDQAMRDEWHHVRTGKAKNKTQNFDKQAQLIAFPTACSHAH